MQEGRPPLAAAALTDLVKAPSISGSDAENSVRGDLAAVLAQASYALLNHYDAPTLSPQEMHARMGRFIAVTQALTGAGSCATPSSPPRRSPPTRGDDLVRADLCDSEVRLAALLNRLLPHQPEVLGLRGLLLATDARRAARVDRAGRLVRLADPDRSRWRHADLDLGIELTTEALTRSGTEPGAWTLQAAIAVANVAPQPDCAVIAALYDRFAAVHPSRAVLANRAAATALAAGPDAGLAALGPNPDGGHLVHALRAELLAELGRRGKAADAFRAAIEAARNDVERRHLADRMDELGLTPLP